jgi:hypothetical protein
MEFNDNEHVYVVVPDILGNKESEKPATFHLKGISQDDFNQAVVRESIIRDNHTREEAAKLIAENSSKLVGDRVVKIENMVCGSHTIETYSDLCKHGPRELVAWISGAVYSSEVLRKNEIKN